MDKFIGGCIGAFVIFLLMAFLTVYFTVANGFIISTFWAWFVMSVFTSLPALTMVQAIGLSMFYGAFTGSHYKAIKEIYNNQEKDKIQKITIFVMLVLIPWFVLLTGYVFKIMFMR